jgi:hypothetical protein
VGGDDVHVAETAIERARLENGGCSRRIIHQVYCLDRTLYAIYFGQPQPCALFRARRVALDNALPNFANGLM